MLFQLTKLPFYCFQVKESLTHVHVLLDHQLMDMAWSDNLADCEENLLKVTNIPLSILDAAEILVYQVFLSKL